MKTFKQLQNEVLATIGDQDDVNVVRDLVKTRLKDAHTTLLTEEQWDFMLYPHSSQLSVVAEQKNYNLHPQFFQPLYFWDANNKQYLEVVPPKQFVEVGEDLHGDSINEPDRVSITTIQGIQNQPISAGVVVVTTTGGTESAANSLVVRGIVDGMEREETLSSGSAWSTLTGSLSFSHIDRVTKVGESWSRSITVTVGATTVISLLAAEFGKQFQQLEFLVTPATTNTINYRFYRKPFTLNYDNDMPDCPSEFDEILKLKTKLAMVGFSRPSPEELEEWKDNLKEKMKSVRQTYQQARALNSRARYVTYIPRW